MDAEPELLFFINPTGALGVSLDDGEHVIIPAGRNIARSPVWEESDEDWTLDDLTLEQNEKVGQVWARIESRRRRIERRLETLYEPDPKAPSPAWQREMFDPEPTPVEGMLDLDDLFD